ncbi:hypothetical protein BGZ63DRAFT_387636, partial [Mariannaea sp. PMI_226]
MEVQFKVLVYIVLEEIPGPCIFNDLYTVTVTQLPPVSQNPSPCATLLSGLTARSARPVMVIAASKPSILLASNTPGSLGGAGISSRLKGSQKSVAGFSRRQARTHLCAIVGASGTSITGSRAGPFAGLNTGHGGQSIDNV